MSGGNDTTHIGRTFLLFAIYLTTLACVLAAVVINAKINRVTECQKHKPYACWIRVAPPTTEKP